MQKIRSSIAQAGGSPYWLADARIIRDGALARVDIRIEDGRIAALAPLGTARDGISLDGGQVWPGLVDGHTHLDKGHIWPRMKNGTGDFAGAIAAERLGARSVARLQSEQDRHERSSINLASS